MKFDVVIGNPPYNDNVYLDFIEKGHGLLKEDGNLIMITPAKFIYRLSEQDKAFKAGMLKHFSDMVYFLDAGDVFDIRLQGGVAYFVMNKRNNKQMRVMNCCEKQPLLDSNGEWQLRDVEEHMVIHNDTALSVCNKLGVFDKDFSACKCAYVPVDGNWNLFIASVNGISSSGKTSSNILSNSGNMTVLGPITVTNDGNFGSPDIRCFFSARTKEEADSYASYLNTKLVRFMLLLRMCSYHNDNPSTWKFVPEQEVYDHIYSDAELYAKYKLSDAEIALVEASVVAR